MRAAVRSNRTGASEGGPWNDLPSLNALPLPCAEPENVMVRHTDSPQGLAYRDGSGLACVLADFGSAKMLRPLTLDTATTEHEPMSKTWWHTLRPAGSPEASVSCPCSAQP